MGVMPFPFGQMPTVREFIDSAVSQNCHEGTCKAEIVGPRGPIQARYLRGRGEQKNVICILPTDENERLTPTQLASFVRRLGLRGFDDLLIGLL